VFRGFSALNLDVKGRLAIPRRYRELLTEICNNALVLTLNPLDRCLWLYPLPEWEIIESKLQSLSDFARLRDRLRIR
jgi:MraZ protein